MSTVTSGASQCTSNMIGSIQCATCAYYQFDEATQDVAHDSSGNKYDLVGEPYTSSVTGKINSGWTVWSGWGGSDPEPTCFEIQLKPGRTAWGWIKQTSSWSALYGGHGGVVGVAGVGGDNRVSWSIGTSQQAAAGPSPGPLAFYLALGLPNWTSVITSPYSFGTGTWYFVAVAIDWPSSTAFLRVNGTTYPTAINTALLNGQRNNVDLNFVGTLTSEPNWADGIGWVYDEWGFACRVLTDDELDYIYKSGNGRRIC